MQDYYLKRIKKACINSNTEKFGFGEGQKAEAERYARFNLEDVLLAVEWSSNIKIELDINGVLFTNYDTGEDGLWKLGKRLDAQSIELLKIINDILSIYNL